MTDSRLVGAEKIVDRHTLVGIAANVRARGDRVVLTNGCFDVLHVGHVRYLRQARELGATGHPQGRVLLVVGLNSDASVRRLKGSDRPINAAADRAEVLAAVESVDVITIFDEDTAEELVTDIKPDVYVKGGDYSDDPGNPRYPVEGRVVSRYGGQVRTLRLECGYSTSAIIQRMRSSTQAPDRLTPETRSRESDN